MRIVENFTSEFFGAGSATGDIDKNDVEEPSVTNDPEKIKNAQSLEDLLRMTASREDKRSADQEKPRSVNQEKPGLAQKEAKPSTLWEKPRSVYEEQAVYEESEIGVDKEKGERLGVDRDEEKGSTVLSLFEEKGGDKGNQSD